MEGRGKGRGEGEEKRGDDVVLALFGRVLDRNPDEELADTAPHRDRGTTIDSLANIGKRENRRLRPDLFTQKHVDKSPVLRRPGLLGVVQESRSEAVLFACLPRHSQRNVFMFQFRPLAAACHRRSMGTLVMLLPRRRGSPSSSLSALHDRGLALIAAAVIDPSRSLALPPFLTLRSVSAIHHLPALERTSL